MVSSLHLVQILNDDVMLMLQKNKAQLVMHVVKKNNVLVSL